MDTKQFNEHLNKIFKLNESLAPVTPEMSLVDPNEVFRNDISARLRGLRKSPEGQNPGQVGPGKPGESIMETPKDLGPIGPMKFHDRHPATKNATERVGVQPTPEAILAKLAELMKTPVENFSLSPNPFPTGERGVFLKVDRRHKDPMHYSNGGSLAPLTPLNQSTENIGAVWPAKDGKGFIFKHHENPHFGHNFDVTEVNNAPVGQNPGQVGPSSVPGQAILDERNNPISVATIKDQVINFGPQGVSQIVAKLSPDMTKTNSEGQPTSDFNAFIDSIKQEGLELLIKYGADAGGVKVPPGGSAEAPTPEKAKAEPGQELASL